MNSKVLIFLTLVTLVIAQNVESAADESETADTKKDKRGLHGREYAYDSWDSGIHLAPDIVHSQVIITKEVPVVHPVKKRAAVPYATKVPVAGPQDRPDPVLAPDRIQVNRHDPRPQGQRVVRRAVPIVKHVPAPKSQPVILKKLNV